MGGFQWKMDAEGKIHNVKDPSFCIENKWKQMYLSTCVSDKNSQQWAYSVLEKRFFVLLKWRMSATVSSATPVARQLVRFLESPVNGVQETMEWTIEQI